MPEQAGKLQPGVDSQENNHAIHAVPGDVDARARHAG
jgi:hypothetical protein